MKISLKLLLGIVLLAALVVNGTNNFQAADAIRAECVKLESSIAKFKHENRFSDERKLVYQRASAGFELRRARLLEAPEFFESVAQMHRPLETKNSDLVRVMSISGAKDENFLHERFRIGLPKSPQFELCLGYHKTESENKLPLDLKDSKYFLPSELVTIPLNPGESLVEFKVPYEITTTPKTSHLVAVIIDGEVVHEAMRVAVTPFWRIRKPRNWPREIVSVLGKERQMFVAEPLRLVTVNAWPTTTDPESVSLILRPIEEQPNE